MPIDVPVGFREYQIRRPYPCGIAAVDELMGDGFPRGAVSEISGNQSSNRTALTVSILVQAFDAGSAAPGSMPATPSIQNRRPKQILPRTTALD
jgi:RecA/RadA recombinase